MSSHKSTTTYAQRLDDLFVRISFGIIFVMLAFGALSFLIHTFPRSGFMFPPHVENSDTVNGTEQEQ